MPKYYEFKVAGYYLYFYIPLCDWMYVHTSDRKLTEAGSAKFLWGIMARLFCRTGVFWTIERFVSYKDL